MATQALFNTPKLSREKGPTELEDLKEDTRKEERKKKVKKASSKRKINPKHKRIGKGRFSFGFVSNVSKSTAHEQMELRKLDEKYNVSSAASSTMDSISNVNEMRRIEIEASRRSQKLMAEKRNDRIKRNKKATG